MIAFLSLSGFYVASGSFSQAAFPVVVVKAKTVLDLNELAITRGVRPGMTLREAKAVLHDGKYVEWNPDDYREAQKAWLDVCTDFTDVIEPEEQHSAYLDLSMHPDPGDVLRSLVKVLMETAGSDEGRGTRDEGLGGRAYPRAGKEMATGDACDPGSTSSEETQDEGSGGRAYPRAGGEMATGDACDPGSTASEVTRDEGSGGRAYPRAGGEMATGDACDLGSTASEVTRDAGSGGRAYPRAGEEMAIGDACDPGSTASEVTQATSPLEIGLRRRSVEGGGLPETSRAPSGPDPCSLIPDPSPRPASRVPSAIAVHVGVARVKWLAKAALYADDTDQLAYRYPKLFLDQLPTAMLSPVSPEHRERLGFLGYKKAGQVVDLPLEVLRSQFGDEALAIHRAVRGGMKARVKALYPLRCASARFSFESPVESTEALERGLAELAGKLSEQLRENDLQGCDLEVRVGYEDAPDEILRRNFAKPMQSEASVLFGLKLVMKGCLDDGEKAGRLSATAYPVPEVEKRSDNDVRVPSGPDPSPLPDNTPPVPSRGARTHRPLSRGDVAQAPSGPDPYSLIPDPCTPTPYPLTPTPDDGSVPTSRISTLRVQMPNLVRASRKQGNLYTLQASRQLTVAEAAFEQMRKTYGTEAVLTGSQVQEPRRKRVLQVWKDALGWV